MHIQRPRNQINSYFYFSPIPNVFTDCNLFSARSACIAESDLTHDYAEIYTPSGEKVCSMSWECNGDRNGKPPTPPLHRFPSWESRIYRVANEGLSNSAPTHSELSCNLPHSASYTGTGYYDVSCPVYATVKGVSIFNHYLGALFIDQHTWAGIIHYLFE